MFVVPAQSVRPARRRAARRGSSGPIGDDTVSVRVARMAGSIAEPHDVARPSEVLVPAEPGFAVRWAAFRERWRQLTFYLFDPNNWR
jgi:hypothetical protein